MEPNPNPNPNPFFPAEEQLNLQMDVNIAGVNAINAIPTNAQVVHEHNRFNEVERSQRRGVGLNDNAFGVVIMRHQNVMNVHTAVDLGVDDNIFHRLDAFGQLIDANTVAMEQRFALIEARIEADRARNYNNLHCFTPRYDRTRFRRVVKHNHGHPTPQPPPDVTHLGRPQQPVLFAPGGYLVGANPPDGLVPCNFRQLLAMERYGVVRLRRALRGIYWFYNNPQLEFGENANLGEARAILIALRTFLTEN